MILGWSLPRDRQDGPLEEVTIDGISAIFGATDVIERRLRAIVQLNLTCSRDGFLPAAPHFQLSRHEAVSWTKAKAAAILARLGTLNGCVQVTTQMCIEVPLAKEANESWLSARMRRLRSLQARKEAIVKSLQQAALDFDARGIRTRDLPDGVAIDLLVKAERAEAVKQDIAALLDPLKEKCAVVGPLPAYGFSDLSEAICTTP